MSVSNQSPTPPEGMWEKFKHACREPVAAASAIIPCFYGFQVKSAQQTNAPIPKFSPFEALRAGVRAAPVVGVMVGTQRIAQNWVEKNVLGSEESRGSFASAFASASFVGSASTPLMAIFTGMTKGKSPYQSLRALSFRQVAAASFMEAGFLFGMGAVNPMVELFNHHFGKSKAVDYFAAFVSGSLGALAGHPGDAALTRWQNGMKVERIAQAYRGALARSFAVGLFTLVYKAVKESIT